jgi:hypothetical protein
MAAKGQPKTGGRKLGTKNRRNREAAEILTSMGCDPIRGMARIAMNHKHNPELRGRMHAELAKYVHPQLRAIEHSGTGPEGAIDVNVIESARQQLADRISRAAVAQGAGSGDSKPD